MPGPKPEACSLKPLARIVQGLKPVACSLGPALARVAACLLGCMASFACSDKGADAASAQATYSQQTGRLSSLAFDSNHDGKLDTWSYMDGARALRIEMDRDGDGKLDRWEYYGPENTLTKVGFSRANDGRVDAWAFAGPDGQLARVEVSTRRDGKITRTEYYEHDTLVRAEEDSQSTGRIDKWETYANGALATVSIDTARSGRPDRRIIYGPNGNVRIENLATSGPPTR